jgi:hypothetical protein
MVDKIWEKLNSLTEDAQNAATVKAEELGFDLNKGAVTLDEAFINLNADTATLRDAIEKKKLIQLPISVQKILVDSLENITRFLTNLTSGTDEIVNLVDAIEGLHTAVWQYGLQNLSKEYLGYQTKLNQVKSLEVQLRQLKKTLEEGLSVKNSLGDLVAEVEQVKASLAGELQTAQSTVKTSSEHLAKVVDADQKAAALLATISQNQLTSSDQLSKTTTSSSEVTALEAKIKEFYSQIDTHRKAIESASQKATSTVEDNNRKTRALVAELDGLEGQIREQIRRATGHSLFHSFQTRQERLAKTKMFWIYALAALVLISVSFSLYLAHSTQSFDILFYLKLSLTIPMLFAIVFCTVQYSRERRLEEEYAFKSNISISLVPYQELVEKLVDKKQASERDKFATFLMAAVTNVFTSPTDKIWETTEKDSSVGDKSVKRVVALIKPIIKGLQH